MYILDFDCILVQLKDFSNAELMKRKNELSIVMLIEKLQSADDFKTLEQEVDSAYMQEAVEHSPEYLLDIMSQIVEVLLAKLNIPQEEIDGFTGQIKERNMAELFANFKAYDVQATRAEARAEGKKVGQEQEREAGIEKLIKAAMELGASKERTCQQLMKQYELTESEAAKKVEQYWN